MAGLKDASGQIVIDEAEAEEDIRKIEQAKSNLIQVRRILDPTKLDRTRLQGDTLEALEEKYIQIGKDLTDWEDACNGFVKYIRTVVANYKRIDQEFARKAKGD